MSGRNWKDLFEGERETPRDYVDLLFRTAFLAGLLATRLPNVWGWNRRSDLSVPNDFSKNHRLKVKSYQHDSVYFCRSDNPESTVHLFGVSPEACKNNKVEIVRTGESKIIQAHTTTPRNNLSTEVKQSGDLAFETGSVRTIDKAITAGVKTSLEQTVSYGGDASPVSGETKVAVEASLETSFSESVGESETRSLSSHWEVTLKPGQAIKVTATRELYAAMLEGEGYAPLEFGINVGLHRHGHWMKHHHHRRHLYWPTRQAMIDALSGKGARDLDCALHCRDHPMPSEYINLLKREQEADHYSFRTPFDAPAAETKYTYDEVQ